MAQKGGPMTSVARRFGAKGATFERPAPVSDELRAPVVLMVSGGADSSALLHLAATSSLDLADGRGTAPIARDRLHVLHINHGLRGLDAQEDEEFVQDLGRRYGIPVTVRRVDVQALVDKRPGQCFEGVAREVRYAEANALANALSDRFGTPRSAARIVTAHTADDRAETFFMNALRGSGLSGLASIPRRRNRIVRPLLDRTHQELCDLLRMQGIVWREDATNADTAYLRNFVRHEVMPLLAERNPRVVASVASGCDILSDEDSYLSGLASRALGEVSLKEGEGIRLIDGGRLRAMDVALARRVVRQALLALAPEGRFEAPHINGVLALCAQGTGSVTVAQGIDCRMEYGVLSLRTRERTDPVGTGWLEVPGRFELADGRVLVADLVQAQAADDVPAMARARSAEFGGKGVLLDAARSGVGPEGGRLWVGPPEVGEVLCPLGMHGQSKRLSDLLAEKRIPAAEREGVAVVRQGPGGSVVWVAAVRPDERCRVDTASRTLLSLEIQEP